jgi:hypothetical protein
MLSIGLPLALIATMSQNLHAFSGQEVLRSPSTWNGFSENHTNLSVIFRQERITSSPGDFCPNLRKKYNAVVIGGHYPTKACGHAISPHPGGKRNKRTVLLPLPSMPLRDTDAVKRACADSYTGSRFLRRLDSLQKLNGEIKHAPGDQDWEDCLTKMTEGAMDSEDIKYAKSINDLWRRVPRTLRPEIAISIRNGELVDFNKYEEDQVWVGAPRRHGNSRAPLQVGQVAQHAGRGMVEKGAKGGKRSSVPEATEPSTEGKGKKVRLVESRQQDSDTHEVGTPSESATQHEPDWQEDRTQAGPASWEWHVSKDQGFTPSPWEPPHSGAVWQSSSASSSSTGLGYMGPPTEEYAGSGKGSTDHGISYHGPSAASSLQAPADRLRESLQVQHPAWSGQPGQLGSAWDGGWKSGQLPG